MTPYDEAQAIGFAQDCVALISQDAGRVGVNCARMQADATGHDDQPPMGYPASRAKHLNELRAELGLPPIAPLAPRTYAGNMCGVRIPGLSAVDGGAADASLFLSWFYARYANDQQVRIRQALSKYPDWLLSWPDDRSIGLSPQQFGAQCQSLIGFGHLPAVMLLSKNYDPTDFDGCMANIAPVLPYIVGLVPRMCIGFELDSFLSPEVLHALIDALTPQFVAAGCKCYVHFTPGKGAWQENHHQTCDFWNPHMGQLTGLWHQRIPGSSAADYQYNASGCLDDMLIRFAGADGFSPDSGFGHPWDLIALEITASEQFAGTMSEADGDSWGRLALAMTPRIGPLGPVPVQGSGNGS